MCGCAAGAFGRASYGGFTVHILGDIMTLVGASLWITGAAQGSAKEVLAVQLRF